MAAASSTMALPSIAALPPTTARQIGSGQVLVDASSVVKELIDNALDARAKIIFVDIAADTIDAIQVKDDGHGIPSEDRPLVCRRYCTSKIRDWKDMRDVGGKWLGFRGEALSSIADMSSALVVTTRCEGEPVAVKLKYGRDGELASTERDSHPIGTTIRVTDFFDNIPVRKQAAIKNAAKCLARIRRLIQAYVLARPGIRFRLRVLKAKSNAGDLVYAPKADASVEDAVLKMFGKDCAIQCSLVALEADGFEIHAFLPKPTAVGSKISNYGSFVSVDARPVSSHRGTIKQLVRACKDQLGQITSLARVRDPFLCLNITCPPGSYDANVEPAKDDVLFENSEAVLRALDKLLRSHYPQAVTDISNDPSLAALQNGEIEPGEAFAQDENKLLSHGCSTINRSEAMDSTPQPRWRPSMYGIDEDDLDFLQDDQAPIIDEEEGRRAIEISNPWTIARMNATIKPRQVATNGQLPSPAKSTKDVNGYSSPSKISATPSRIISAEPLTPQASSEMNTMRSLLDDELERSIQRLSQPISVTGSDDNWLGEHRRDQLSDDRSLGSVEAEVPGSPSQSRTQGSDKWTSSSARHGNMDLEMAFSAGQATHCQQLIQDPKPLQRATHQKRTTNSELPYSQTDVSLRLRKSLPAASGQTRENRLYSNNDKDIRDCFRQSNQVRENCLAQERSFTSINQPAQAVQTRSLSLLAPVDQHRPIPQNERDALQPALKGPRKMQGRLQTYFEREVARPSWPAESQILMQFDHRLAMPHQPPVHNSDSAISSGTKHSSPASPQSNTTPVPRQISRTNRRSQTTDQMNAFFQSHLEKAPAYHLPRPIPRLAKSHHSHSPAADTSDLTNPSTHPLYFSTTITIEHIALRALTYHDCLPRWNCAAEDMYNSFNEPILEDRIAVWVDRLDGLLSALYRRVCGVQETKSVLVKGVRRALGEKSEGVDAGSESGERGYAGCDVVSVADDDGCEEKEDIEEEMLMDV